MSVRSLAAAALMLVALVARSAPAAEFVGAESCRSCHAAAYEAWRESPHARAFKSLSAEHRNDARCLQCHAPNVSMGGDAGVSCETCHGAGEHYWPDYVMRDAELARAAGLVTPDARSCMVCHDASSPSLLPFDVDAAMKAIDHWSADRKARNPRSAAVHEGTPARRDEPVRTAATNRSEVQPARAADVRPDATRQAAPKSCDRAAARRAAAEARPSDGFLARALRGSGTASVALAVVSPAPSGPAAPPASGTRAD